ncbi:MAG: 50S ribosomal protein L10 [Thermogutta sp.]|nr:50S ribosomal protein L10 [Thermogutta sp.]
MSKFVKQQITDFYRRKLDGVDAAVLVNVIGLNGPKTTRLRRELAEKNIRVMVVKNTLARRALTGTPLEAAFTEAAGPTAICWGGTDIVALAKEVMRLAEDETFSPFAPKGGVMEGERLTAEQVKEISNWPSREEVLAKIAGQILAPAANLSALIGAVGQTLAGQIEQIAEKDAETESPAEQAASTGSEGEAAAPA